MDVVVWICIGQGRYFEQNGSCETNRVFFLLALGIWHDNDRLIALGIADEAKTDTSVPSSALNNDASWLEETFPFGILKMRGNCMKNETWKEK